MLALPMDSMPHRMPPMHVCLLFLPFFLLFSCLSEHDRRNAEVQQLTDFSVSIDTTADIGRAIYLTEYMEQHGNALERQKAWQMLGKVYRQQHQPAFEMQALRMAIGCVDRHRSFDTLQMASCYFDLSTCLHNNRNYLEAVAASEQACSLMEAAHDTIRCHIWMGARAWTYTEMGHGETARHLSDSAYRYLRAHGKLADAVDARLLYIFHFLHHGTADSAVCWLREYARLTKRNLASPRSRDAIFFWRAMGEYWRKQGQADSAAWYFRKMLQPGSPNNEAMVVGYWCLYRLYDEIGNADSAQVYCKKFQESRNEGGAFNIANFIDDANKDYAQRHRYVEMQQQSNRIYCMLAAGVVVVLMVAVFLLSRYAFLRRRYHETLEQNREYVRMLESLKNRMPRLTSTDIARRFHELSSQDAHPSASEWQALHRQIEDLYPAFFPTLAENYARQVSGQGLTEQEQRIVGLIAIRCTPLQMSVLLVCSKSNVSNMRRRLFRKLTGMEGTGTDLDRLVADICQ